MAKRKKIEKEHQVAALPVRAAFDGSQQILLVTSRDTGRWIIPKGWPMKDRTDAEAAATEAYEEAGLLGLIGQNPIGTFDYTKVMPKGEKDIPVRADVYILQVEDSLDQWPEDDERKRQWFSAKEAAKRVDEPDLKALILSLASTRKMAS